MYLTKFLNSIYHSLFRLNHLYVTTTLCSSLMQFLFHQSHQGNREEAQNLNSPYRLPYITFNASSENLVVHQDVICQLMISLLLLPAVCLAVGSISSQFVSHISCPTPHWRRMQPAPKTAGNRSQLDSECIDYFQGGNLHFHLLTVISLNFSESLFSLRYLDATSCSFQNDTLLCLLLVSTNYYNVHIRLTINSLFFSKKHYCMTIT